VRADDFATPLLERISTKTYRQSNEAKQVGNKKRFLMEKPGSGKNYRPEIMS
jgi:hypothetical protein